MFLGTGLILAAVTAFSGWKVISSYQKELVEARRPIDKVDVMVASHDLLPGETIEEDDVSMLLMTTTEMLNAKIYGFKDEVIGKVLEERVLAGEPIREERFERVDAGQTLAVPEGARAVTVKVDREGGLGGMLKPGAYVDLIVTIRPDENNLGAAWVTATILQGVRVLAVGTTLQLNASEDKETESKRLNPPREMYVTLEVEPDEASLVAMASARGDIHLTLRSEGDLTLMDHEKPLVTNTMVGLSSPTSPARVRRLAVRQAESKVEPKEVPLCSSAEVIEGNKVTQEHFDAEGRKLQPPVHH